MMGMNVMKLSLTVISRRTHLTYQEQTQIWIWHICTMFLWNIPNIITWNIYNKYKTAILKGLHKCGMAIPHWNKTTRINSSLVRKQLNTIRMIKLLANIIHWHKISSIVIEITDTVRWAVLDETHQILSTQLWTNLLSLRNQRQVWTTKCQRLVDNMKWCPLTTRHCSSYNHSDVAWWHKSLIYFKFFSQNYNN